MSGGQTISKKRKFVADGVFYAELNEFLTRELGQEGYSGVEVRVTPIKTEIIIRATRTQSVLGENGRRIRELTSLVQKRFNFPDGSVELYAERVNNRALCAVTQAESLRYKLGKGLAVRRACYGVLRYIMENGAKGCEITVSGKLRAQRAKVMKFRQGYMIKSGFAAASYVDKAVRHLKLKQGVLGVKVAVMLPYDETGKNGCSVKQPDVISVLEPKPEEPVKFPEPKKKAPAAAEQGPAGTQEVGPAQPVAVQQVAVQQVAVQQVPQQVQPVQQVAMQAVEPAGFAPQQHMQQ